MEHNFWKLVPETFKKYIGYIESLKHRALAVKVWIIVKMKRIKNWNTLRNATQLSVSKFFLRLVGSYVFSIINVNNLLASAYFKLEYFILK